MLGPIESARHPNRPAIGQLLTIDYNAQGAIIGIEVIGTLARRGSGAIIQALLEADDLAAPAAVRESLSSLLAA